MHTQVATTMADLDAFEQEGADDFGAYFTHVTSAAQSIADLGNDLDPATIRAAENFRRAQRSCDFDRMGTVYETVDAANAVVTAYRALDPARR